MKVTIADRRHLAAAAADEALPDIRERVLTVVLELLADHGVDDIEMIIATSLHRRMTGLGGAPHRRRQDLQRLLAGSASTTTTPKTRRDEVELGETELRRGRRAQPPRGRERPAHLREPQPRPDGRRAQVGAVGLCGYKSLRAHHNPKVMRKCHSYMDPRRVELNTSVERMGKV
jgi:hypothetical protein